MNVITHDRKKGFAMEDGGSLTESYPAPRRTKNSSHHNSDEGGWKHDQLMEIGRRQSGLDDPEELSRAEEEDEDIFN